MKKYLFVMRRLPHSGIHLQETLDMILTTAAFDQQVSLLFIDDGVFQLKIGQNPASMQLKDTAAIFTALEIYDVQHLYVERESLTARGLVIHELILPVQPIARTDINLLMAGHDVIVPD